MEWLLLLIPIGLFLALRKLVQLFTVPSFPKEPIQEDENEEEKEDL